MRAPPLYDRCSPGEADLEVAVDPPRMPTWHAWVEIAALAALVTAAPDLRARASLDGARAAPGRRALRLVLGGRLRGRTARDGERRRALVRRARRAHGPADPRVAARGPHPGQFCDAWRRRLHQLAVRACERPSASMRWRGHPTRWHMRPSRSSAIPRAGARPSRPRSGRVETHYTEARVFDPYRQI